MFLTVLLGMTVTIVVCSLLAAKSMRAADAYRLILLIIHKSGLFGLMRLLPRPTAYEYEASNGTKTIVPNPAFGLTIEETLKFKTREDDVFVASYPKAGTTWMQEIVWLICNRADTVSARSKKVTVRYGFIDTIDFGNDLMNGIQSLERWPKARRRMIKTHFPFELLPMDVQSKRKCKVVYVARNAKDVCVSYYHFHRMVRGLPDPGTWKEFLAKFCSGSLGKGCWFKHNLKYWKKHQERGDQIYFLTYEALKRNLRAELVPLAKFLGVDLSNKQFDTIAEHCTFANMSKNKSTNYSAMRKYGVDFKTSKFMRKGEVGDWKNYFTVNESAAFDRMYEEKMNGSGLKFDFAPYSVE